MKKILCCIFLIVLATILGIPMLVFFNFQKPQQELLKDGVTVRVLNTDVKEIKEINLEEYLVGVVAAEMPAKFDEEALKSQAVAARTYTVKRMFGYGAKPDDIHPDAEICTDPTHCQAWAGTQELKKKWGQLNYLFYISKIRKTVKATKGEVITYNGQLIDPVYHGSCGGIGTENSEDVWSSEIPYLRGVNCQNEYTPEKQVFTVTKTNAEISSLLRHLTGTNGKSVGDKVPDIHVISKTDRGRVKEVELFGTKILGTDLRKKLGLTSTAFTWKVSGDTIVFTSKGKGHAVGLCQFGANGMALGGSNYREILRHYYSGIKIKKIK